MVMMLSQNGNRGACCKAVASHRNPSPHCCLSPFCLQRPWLSCWPLGVLCSLLSLASFLGDDQRRSEFANYIRACRPSPCWHAVHPGETVPVAERGNGKCIYPCHWFSHQWQSSGFWVNVNCQTMSTQITKTESVRLVRLIESLTKYWINSDSRNLWKWWGAFLVWMSLTGTGWNWLHYNIYLFIVYLFIYWIPIINKQTRRQANTLMIFSGPAILIHESYLSFFLNVLNLNHSKNQSYGSVAENFH